jgi:hypothetical protein
MWSSKPSIPEYRNASQRFLSMTRGIHRPIKAGATFQVGDQCVLPMRLSQLQMTHEQIQDYSEMRLH